MYAVLVDEKVVDAYEDLEEAIANACQLAELYRTGDVDVIKYVGRVVRKTTTEYVAWESNNVNIQ